MLNKKLYTWLSKFIIAGMIVSSSVSGVTHAATGDIINITNKNIYDVTSSKDVQALIADLKDGGGDKFLKEDTDGKYYSPNDKLTSQSTEIVKLLKAANINLTDPTAIKTYIKNNAVAMMADVKVATDNVVAQTVDTSNYTKVTSVSDIAVKSVSAINGTINVTFNNALTSMPSISDFAITQKSENGDVTVIPTFVTTDLTMKIATLILPMVDPIKTEQNILYGVSYESGVIVNSGAFIVESQTDSSTIVTFPDENLEQVVRDSINKPTGDIFKSDVINITTLTDYNNSIANLSGIEKLSNLENIEFYPVKISDIAPLSGLTRLKSISLSRSESFGEQTITDISPLKGLTNLTYLWLGGNYVTDITALQGLTKLETVGLGRNYASEQQMIQDFSPLKGLTNLTELELSGNNFTDTSIIKEFKNLKYLDLSRGDSPTNKIITDFSFLSVLTNLESLNLSRCGFKDINLLKGLSQLNDLSLYYNNITDISAISNLKNLTSLNLLGNNIVNIDGLKGLTNLTTLDLRWNQISDVAAVRGLTNLTYLQLDGNHVTDYSPTSSYYKNLFSPNFTLDPLEIQLASAFNGLISVTFDYALAKTPSIYDFVTTQTIGGVTTTVIPTGITMDSTMRTATLRVPMVVATATDQSVVYGLSYKGGTVVNSNTFTVAKAIDNSTIVTFQDKNLERAVRDNINKPIGDIMKSDVDKITELYASKYQITNLSGIENLSSLTILDLNGNQISNIDDLKGLTNLTSLVLLDNKITNIDALTGLTNLGFLDLSNNQINNIDNLKRLTNIFNLGLDNNQISNIDLLKGFIKLEQLQLYGKKVSDITPLEKLTNLKNLNLAMNEITNVDALKGLTSLNFLALSNNQVSNIDDLEGLTNLFTMYLDYNQISNIGVLKGLTNLTELYLSGNKITDYSPTSSYYSNLNYKDFTLQ
ncbi:leucine-rich repeat domain-containing protein [Clostridium sp. DSM 17811]|nr:leucine-rich repeat domain-containing protein [Clostridium sp. DSM 17811]MBU3101783.1 leucine-rich repeat domain-containing protein [Clostridium sp. DSM 17811]